MSASSSVPNPSYTDSNGNTVVPWTVNKDVRIIAYPNGRGFIAVKGPSITDTKMASQRVEEAAKARLNGEGFMRLDGYGGLLQPAQHILTCIVPETKEIITKFSRFPENDEDFSTPFFCVRSKALVEQIGIPLSAFALRPRGCKLVDNAIKNYLDEQKNQVDDWIEFSDKHYFQKWCQTTDTIFGYEAFSSLAWGITAHFILGVPVDEHHDFSHIWNRLFSPNTNILSKAKLLMFDYKKELIPFILTQISKAKKNLTEYSSTVIAYCEREKICENLLKELNDEELSEGTRLAKDLNISLEDHLLFSIIIMIGIGMQENFAFTLTESLRRISNEPELLEICRTDKDAVLNTIQETLRIIPPAGHSRQLRWDTTITYKAKNYELNKGDLIGTHPLFIGHNPDIFPEPEQFIITRSSKAKGCPFGKGPHHCPGEILALMWMSKTIHRLIEHFNVKTSNPEKLDFCISFTMKHVPKIEIKLSQIGVIEPTVDAENGCTIS